MAPEQWLAEEPDCRADVYALGCVLYEMLAGRPPFAAQELWGLRRQHLETPPPSLPVDTVLPSGLTDLLRQCLANRPPAVSDARSAVTKPGRPLPAHLWPLTAAFAG